MTSPLEFLEAAHKQAEEVASACILKVNRGRGEWTRHGPEIRDDLGHLVVKHTWPDEADHIVLHDPAAVLRRIAAERKILAEHQAEREASLPIHDRCSDPKCDCYDYVATCGTCAPSNYYDAEPVPWPCATVRLLAEAWGWQELSPQAAGEG